MVASVKDSGTQTAVIDTEHTLGAAITDAGTYNLKVDAKNMVNGDELTLRVYSKVLPAGAEGLAYEVSFAHVQTELIKISLPDVSPHYFKATLEQTAGTGRSFDWAVNEL